MCGRPLETAVNLRLSRYRLLPNRKPQDARGVYNDGLHIASVVCLLD